MVGQKLLTQKLSEFASTLVRDFSISDVLHDLAERAAAVGSLPSQAQGLSMRPPVPSRSPASPDGFTRMLAAKAGQRRYLSPPVRSPEDRAAQHGSAP
jgi:hypothetical protein